MAVVARPDSPLVGTLYPRRDPAGHRPWVDRDGGGGILHHDHRTWLHDRAICEYLSHGPVVRAGRCADDHGGSADRCAAAPGTPDRPLVVCGARGGRTEQRRWGGG